MPHALMDDGPKQSSLHHGAFASPFSTSSQPSPILPDPDLILPHSDQKLYDKIQEHEISSAFESKQEALVRTHALLTGYAYDNAIAVEGMMTPEASPGHTKHSYDETELSDIYEEDDAGTPGTFETVSLMKNSLGPSEDCDYSGSYNSNDYDTASFGEEDASKKNSRNAKKSISKLDQNLASSRSVSSTERSSTAQAPSTTIQPTAGSDGEPSPGGAIASFILPTYLASQKSSVSTDESQSLPKRRSTRRPTTSLANALMRQSVVNSRPAHEDQTSSSSSSLPRNVNSNSHPRTASDGSVTPIRASHPGSRAPRQLRLGSTPLTSKRSTVANQVRRNSQPQPEVRGLQDQVTDLRIKVSTLKVRTQADNLRRRKSSQRMRGTLSSPSLFTNAKGNQWTGPDGRYRPLRATMGNDNAKDLRAMMKPKQQQRQQQIRDLQQGGSGPFRSSNDYINNSLFLKKQHGDQRHTMHEYQPEPGSPRSRLFAMKSAGDNSAKERSINGVGGGGGGGGSSGSGDSRQSSLRAANLMSRKFAAVVGDDNMMTRGRTFDSDFYTSNIRKTRSTHGFGDQRNYRDRSDSNRGIQRSVSAMPFEDTRNRITSRINESYWRMMNEQTQHAQQEAETYEAEREDTSTPHEQRTDAFDYEKFFLHSALGTYSNGTQDSSSDEDEYYEDEEEEEKEGEGDMLYEEDGEWVDEHLYGDEEGEEVEKGEEENWDNYYDEDLGEHEGETHYMDAEEDVDGDEEQFADDGQPQELDYGNDDDDNINDPLDDSNDDGGNSDATARRSTSSRTPTPTFVSQGKKEQYGDSDSSEDIDYAFQHTHSMPNLRSSRRTRSGTAVRGRYSPALTVTNSDPVDAAQGSYVLRNSNTSSSASEGSTNYLTPRSSLSVRPEMVDSGIQIEFASGRSSRNHNYHHRRDHSPAPSAQSFRTYYSSLNTHTHTHTHSNSNHQNHYQNHHHHHHHDLDIPVDIDAIMDALIERSATVYAPSSVTEARDGRFSTVLRDADRARLAALFTSIGQVAFRLQLSLETTDDDDDDDHENNNNNDDNDNDVKKHNNNAPQQNRMSQPSQAAWAAQKLRERLDAAKKVLDGKVEVPTKSTLGNRVARNAGSRVF